MPDSTRVWIERSALQLMVDDGSRWAPEETGGILVGYWAGDEETVVTAAIDAGPNSTHHAGGFLPDADYQAAQIAKLYEQSGRYHGYLGDWHTHPLGGLSLSRTDRGTMRRIARHADARCPRPLMMLLADSMAWQAAVWSTVRRLGLLRPHPAALQIFER